jgi:hypothetical protein
VSPSLYLGSTDPGKWRPTPPNFTAGAQPYWANVTPFALTSPSQFRPGPPPALDSAAYKAAYDEVKSLGRVDSTTRTADQTQIAEFWAQGTHIVTNEIARTVATQQGFSLAQNARLFALLNIAVADAFIAGWDAKYHYSTWRPITAINLGSYNPDPNWTPLLSPTPSHPEYVSSHGIQGSAAFTILRDIFGDNVSFSADSPSLPDVTRSFTSFTQAELENGRSRIYGGLHFQFSNEAGQVAGESVGNYVFANELTLTGAVPEPSSLVLVSLGVVGLLCYYGLRRRLSTGPAPATAGEFSQEASYDLDRQHQRRPPCRAPAPPHQPPMGAPLSHGLK